MSFIGDNLGIRPLDAGIAALAAAAVELNIAVAAGPGQARLDWLAYLLGAVLALPILLRHRWPFPVLIACSVLLFVYYAVHRRDISPVPLLAFPLYDAALAGYLAWAIVIPAVYMTIGLFVVDAATHQNVADLAASFLPSVVLLALAIMLGQVVRSRRELAAETADRLRLAAEERESEAARQVAEERLRIARELHDTVAHSMATITVRAASALHLLGGQQAAAGGQGTSGEPGTSGELGTSGEPRTTGEPGTSGEPGSGAATAGTGIRDALLAIRTTSKQALADIRLTLGQLRGDGDDTADPDARSAGLARLGALADAVRSAGAPVNIVIEGDQMRLPAAVDHVAYRILQESLTNVLRHAGPQASATIRLAYARDALTIEVCDDGASACQEPPGGTAEGAAGRHGITGMTERTAALGGRLAAGPRPGGGFEVLATLPLAPAVGPVL